ncbi:MAG: 30S ribosomal protein S9 [bacterium]|jgi:small subunit ribosomal protein S9|nr:30S ribosomal protein S9 [bacterium]
MVTRTQTKRFYATGRRKTSVARVWIEPGKGEITVNGRQVMEHFRRETLKMVIEQPMETVNLLGKLKIYATVNGGGLAGQAGALRLGISRAMVEMDADYRGPLRQAGFMTRDARMVERKKYGQPGARKRFQFSKR